MNISETIFANDDPDTTQLTNGVFKTDARGLAIFYLTNQKRVDVLFTKAGVTSVTIPVDVQKSSLVSGESVATSTIWDAAGDLAKGTGADTAARLARGTANQVLRTNAGATDIEWGVDPTQDKITTAGDILYGTAADTAARLGIGTAGQVLKVNAGATAPEWGAAAAGTDRILIPGYYRESLAASLTNDLLKHSAVVTLDINGVTMVRAGSITGISVETTAPRTAGTATFEAFIGGAATGLTTTLDATNTTFNAASQAAGLDTFLAKDSIRARVTTTADWAPSTSDVGVCIEVTYS